MAVTTPGTARWAKSPVTAPGASFFNNVSTDSSGNIYAVGYINSGQYDFGNSVAVTGVFAGHNTVIVKYAEDAPVLPELPYSGGQPSSPASIGQPPWFLLIGLAGFASIVAGFVTTRKRAKV